MIEVRTTMDLDNEIGKKHILVNYPSKNHL